MDIDRFVLAKVGGRSAQNKIATWGILFGNVKYFTLILKYEQYTFLNYAPSNP